MRRKGLRDMAMVIREDDIEMVQVDSTRPEGGDWGKTLTVRTKDGERLLLELNSAQLEYVISHLTSRH